MDHDDVVTRINLAQAGLDAITTLSTGVLGRAHPLSRRARLTLGEALMRDRHAAQAVKHLLSVYDGCARDLGPEHPMTKLARALVDRASEMNTGKPFSRPSPWQSPAGR